LSRIEFCHACGIPDLLRHSQIGVWGIGRHSGLHPRVAVDVLGGRWRQPLHDAVVLRVLLGCGPRTLESVNGVSLPAQSAGAFDLTEREPAALEEMCDV